MHAPRADSESVNTWTSSVRPDLEEPEHFGRTNGMGTWYCTACTRSPALAHLFSFDPAGAEAHERSPAHRANVERMGRSWLLGELPPDEAAWAMAERTPYADVKARDSEGAADGGVYSAAGVRRRVRAWRRECVIAWGGVPPEEDEEEEREREWDDHEAREGDEDESEVPESVTETTQELHAAGPLLAAAAAPQLVIDDSDSSDSSSSSCSTDVIAKCNRLATTGTSGSTGRSSVPSALVTFKVKTVRTGLSKLAAVRNSLRWLGWPAQKSLERVSRLVGRGRVRH